jgi:hypothetical protein
LRNTETVFAVVDTTTSDLPSPSTSKTTNEAEPVVLATKSTLGSKSVAVISAFAGLKMGLNLSMLLVNKPVPVFNKVMVSCVAPLGTVMVTLVVVAAVTVALVAPQNTILLAAVVLKPVPVRVTASPGLAVKGEKLVIVGACAFKIVVPKNANRQSVKIFFIAVEF